MKAFKILSYESQWGSERRETDGRPHFGSARIMIDEPGGSVLFNRRGAANVIEIVRPHDLSAVQPYLRSAGLPHGLRVERIIFMPPNGPFTWPAGYVGYVLANGEGQLFPRAMPKGWTPENMGARLGGLVA